MKKDVFLICACICWAHGSLGSGQETGNNAKATSSPTSLWRLESLERVSMVESAISGRATTAKPYSLGNILRAARRESSDSSLELSLPTPSRGKKVGRPVTPATGNDAAVTAFPISRSRAVPLVGILPPLTHTKEK